MAVIQEKSDPLREKFKRMRERRIAKLLEKYQQTEKEDIVSKEYDKTRIIEPTKEKLETIKLQQKIDPVITTREVAVSTEPNEVLSPTTFLINVKDTGVQTIMPIKTERKCSNCCGGLPGCGPGLGQGCEGKCSCIPGIQIGGNGLCNNEEFNLNKKLFPRFYVKRHRGNRLRGGGGNSGGKNLKRIIIPRIRCRSKKNSVFQVESLLRRPKEEDLPCRGLGRSLSSLRGQPAWMEEAQESCWESCLYSKNCVGRATVSAECVPSSYNSISFVPGVPERPQNFRRKQNIMAAGSTSWSEKFQLETTNTPLLLPTTWKCVRENVKDFVGNKYRRCSNWDMLGFTFESNHRRKCLPFRNVTNEIIKKTRKNRPNRSSMNSSVLGKTISNPYCPTINCSHFFSNNTKRIERTKTCKEYNFSNLILLYKNSSSDQALKFEGIVERLRGGGSKCNLTDKHKLRQQMELVDQSTVDNLNDIEMKPLHNNKEDNIDSNAMFWENMDEDEYPWSDNVINEDVLRFQEDQGCCGSPEHRNEDGRIRGGCGGLYKPMQHFTNAWTIFGRRDLQHPRGSCCPPVRPQISCRSSPCPPLSCLRSSPTCIPVRIQNRVSCGKGDPCIDRKGCPCNSCGGPACFDNINRCCEIQLKEPCQCKCQTCNKGCRVRICGGCGGQSCGKIYSCSGSGGGTCCFPRNTKRRSGSVCCGGGNSNCGGCC